MAKLDFQISQLLQTTKLVEKEQYRESCKLLKFYRTNKVQIGVGTPTTVEEHKGGAPSSNTHE